MTRAIVIDFDTSPEDADLNFKIWIFAEDLYRALKSNELASLPLPGNGAAQHPMHAPPPYRWIDSHEVPVG